MADLEHAFHQHYGDRVTVLAMMDPMKDEGSDQVVDAYLDGCGVSFPVLWDEDDTHGKLATGDSSAPFPVDVVLDGDGVVRHVGTRYDPDELHRVIESLLEAPEGPPGERTRCLGQAAPPRGANAPQPR